MFYALMLLYALMLHLFFVHYSHVHCYKNSQEKAFNLME